MHKDLTLTPKEAEEFGDKIVNEADLKAAGWREWNVAADCDSFNRHWFLNNVPAGDYPCCCNQKKMLQFELREWRFRRGGYGELCGVSYRLDFSAELPGGEWPGITIGVSSDIKDVMSGVELIHEMWKAANHIEHKQKEKEKEKGDTRDDNT